MATKPKTNVTPVSHNDQFKVISYKLPDGCKVTVYLLNPGDLFEGFGGSRAGLLVTGKKGSLITRTLDHGCMRDFEHDLADPAAWVAINEGLALAHKDGGTVEIRKL